jgi:hypothetical protein
LGLLEKVLLKMIYLSIVWKHLGWDYNFFHFQFYFIGFAIRLRIIKMKFTCVLAFLTIVLTAASPDITGDSDASDVYFDPVVLAK